MSAVLFVGPLEAQTGSGTGPCRPTTSTQALGTFAVGQTISASLRSTCIFTANGAVTSLTVNGTAITGKRTLADGTVPLKIFIKSATRSDVDDTTEVPTVCGVNTIVATAPSAVAGTPVTHTANFTVTCPVATVAQPLVRTGAGSTQVAAVAMALLVLGGLMVTVGRRSFSTRW